MRLLFLASRDWTHPKATGGDAAICDFARWMARQGHDVTLVASRGPGAPIRATLDGVRIVRYGGLFTLAVRACAFYLQRRRQFDAVVEEGLASLRLPFLSALYVGKPVFSLWYQVNAPIFAEQFPWPLARLLSFGERLVLAAQRRALLLTISSDRRADFAALGVDDARLRITPPLMLDAARAPCQPSSGGRQPLIVWIGKIRRYKCPHHVIEALPGVLHHVPDARVVIAGRRDDADYERELRELAQRLGVAGRVEFALDITDEDKFELLARAKALAVTSPVEGFSIVIVEANRCGTPVVATEGVPVDTARDGENGYRVPFADRQALTTALVRILADAPGFTRLSTRSREIAAEFDPERLGRCFEEVLHEFVPRAA